MVKDWILRIKGKWPLKMFDLVNILCGWLRLKHTGYPYTIKNNIILTIKTVIKEYQYPPMKLCNCCTCTVK